MLFRGEGPLLDVLLVALDRLPRYLPDLGVLLDDGWVGTFDGQVFKDFTRNQIIYRSGHGIGDNENLNFKSTSAWTSDEGNMVGVIRNTKKD